MLARTIVAALAACTVASSAIAQSNRVTCTGVLLDVCEGVKVGL